MGWFFYDKTGNVPVTVSAETLATGTIIVSLLAYTADEPDGYLFCNGQDVLKNDYLDLFSAIGTLFGTPANTDYFRLPNFQSKMLRGITNSGAGIGSIAGAGGSKTHQHTLASHDHRPAVSVAHSHTLFSHGHTFNSHRHTLTSHAHGSSTLSVGASQRNWTNIRSGSLQQDTVRATHNHQGSLQGTTAANGGQNSDYTTSATTGFTAYNSADQVFSPVGSDVSSTAAAIVVNPSNNLPPYFTVSFLIKT